MAARTSETRAHGDRIGFDPPSLPTRLQAIGRAFLAAAQSRRAALRLAKLVLPAAIAYILIRPLLAGDYYYPLGEYHLYKAFLQNFLAALRHGEFLRWNPFVGDGHPAMYFGHVPISQNTLIYMAFGLSDWTYYFTKFLSLFVMLASFTWIARRLGFGYFVGLIGGLFYFCINFVLRILPAETVGNLLPLYPVLMLLIPLLVARRPAPVKGIVLYICTYVLWLSGGNITYVPAHIIALGIVYATSVFVYRGRTAWREWWYFIGLFGLIMIMPVAAVLYQYVFVVDVIADSDRLMPGFIVSPLDGEVWWQFLRSLWSSSFVWMTIFLAGLLQLLRLVRGRALPSLRLLWLGKIAALASLIVITIAKIQIPANWPLEDFAPLLNDEAFRLALIAFAVLQALLGWRGRLHILNQPAIWALYSVVSFLAYFIVAPENIIGDKNGYDYDLFMELGPLLRWLFMLLCLYSVTAWRQSRLFRTMVITLASLYLIRSHLTIPLMRFTGFIWYATRDGSIFSVCFAIFSVIGLRRLIADLTLLSRNFPFGNATTWLGGRMASTPGWAGNVLRGIDGKRFLTVALLGLIVLQAHDSWHKMYDGLSHRFIFRKRDPESGWEKSVASGRAEAEALKRTLISLQETDPGFFRIYDPENSYLFLAGDAQDAGVYDAGIYDSATSANYRNFYEQFVLKRRPDPHPPLARLLPYFLFTRHVHAGIGLTLREIGYRGFYIFNVAEDQASLRTGDIRFFWDVSNVKYLLIGPAFEEDLAALGGAGRYRLLARFKTLSLALYERLDYTPGPQVGVLPLDRAEDAGAALAALNSDAVPVMEAARKAVVPLSIAASPDQGYRLRSFSQHNGRNVMDVEADRPGLLIEFESWNKHWRATIDGREAPVEKAFHLFKAIPISPGRHEVVTAYAPPYLFPLIVLGWITSLIAIGALIATLLFRPHPRHRAGLSLP